MFKTWIRVLFGAMLAVSQPVSAASIVEGGLYATPQENGTYIVLKILKRDAHGVHVRIYSNVYRALPERIDEAALSMAGIDSKEGEPLGVGHLPLSDATFSTWSVVFVQTSTVAPEELEGYEMWREAQGGYF